MERRRASSVNVNALRVDGGPETRAMLTDAQAGAEGAFGNKDHTAVIDGEPEEGTGQAGPPSSSINSTPKGKTTGKSGSLRNVGLRRVAPLAVGSGRGRLCDHIAGARSGRRQPLFMPRSRHP